MMGKMALVKSAFVFPTQAALQVCCFLSLLLSFFKLTSPWYILLIPNMAETLGNRSITIWHIFYHISNALYPCKILHWFGDNNKKAGQCNWWWVCIRNIICTPTTTPTSNLWTAWTSSPDNIICLRETFLTCIIPDQVVQPAQFFIVHWMKKTHPSWEILLAGMCLIRNNNWWGDIVYLSKSCSHNLEFLTIQFQPFYLPCQRRLNLESLLFSL